MAFLEREMNLDEIEVELLINLNKSDEIVEFCEDNVTVESLIEALSGSDLSVFSDRVDVCAFLDIGESTLSGWIKAGKLPRMAKLSVMLAYALTTYGETVRKLRASTDTIHVLKAEDGYQLCEFSLVDGVRVGYIIATGIPDLATARLLSSAKQARAALFDAFHVIQDLAANRSVDPDDRRWAWQTIRQIEEAHVALGTHGEAGSAPPKANG